MESTVSVRLRKEEEKLLSQILKAVGAPLTREALCSAAAEEYIRMILGQRVFGSAKDWQEYRLYLLMAHAWTDVLPSERAVASLFQVTPTRARSLIQAVMAKYQYELKQTIDRSLLEVLRSASAVEGEDELRFVVKSELSVRAMQELLKGLDGNLTPIRRTEKAGEYKIQRSVRDALIAYVDGK